MKLIKASYDILPIIRGGKEIFKSIELAGRTCYKSENKITKESSIKFVKMLIERGHTAMLEHGTVYLQTCISATWHEKNKYEKNKYSKVNIRYNNLGAKIMYITTNYRVLVENCWLKDLQYQCTPTKYHELRLSVKFICDRGISHELVRHTVFSFAQESTRFCNYSKSKFGNELTFIQPCFWQDDLEDNYLFNCGELDEHLINCEKKYLKMIKHGATPQEARCILPNLLKTEIVVTGFASDWVGGYDKNNKPYGMFPLRISKFAHPQMRELMRPLLDEMKIKLPEIFKDINYEK